MGDKTQIEWAEASWNPTVGCSVISPGCKFCYAMRQAGGRLRNVPKYAGLTQPGKNGPVWTGELRADDDAMGQPLRWKRPRRIFVDSMSDLFHEALPDVVLDSVFGVMDLAHWHQYLILTKRAVRMNSEVRRIWKGLHAPHVWLGVSIENRHALLRARWLRDTPAAIRFLSIEPLLEDLGAFDLRGIDWVIVGGESGPGARPMHPDWVRQIRDRCDAAGVAFFFKQWGAWVTEDQAPSDATLPGRSRAFIAGQRATHRDNPQIYLVGKKAAGRFLDGKLYSGYPR